VEPVKFLVAHMVVLRALPSTFDLSQNYKDLGAGKCLANEKSPTYTYNEARDAKECERLCEADVQCHGYSVYSVSSFNNCLLWMESGLTGGGEEWGGAHCLVKSYNDHGEGKCQINGNDPQHIYYPGLDANHCRQLCDAKVVCNGYSVNNDNNCLLWMESGLSGGGGEWGDAHCLRKATTSSCRSAQEELRDARHKLQIAQQKGQRQCASFSMTEFSTVTGEEAHVQLNTAIVASFVASVFSFSLGVMATLALKGRCLRGRGGLREEMLSVD